MDTQDNIVYGVCDCENCNGGNNAVKLNFAVGTVSQVSLNHQPGLLSFGYDDEAGAGIAFLGVGSENKLVTSRLLDLSVGADGEVKYNRYNGLTVQQESFKAYSDDAVLNALSVFCKGDSNIKVDTINKFVKVDVDITGAVKEVRDDFEASMYSTKAELNSKIEAVEAKVQSNEVITGISGKVATLEATVNDINDTLSLHDDAISDAEKVISDLKNKVAVNETAIAAHVNEYNALTEKASTIATDLDDLDGEVDELAIDVEKNKTDIVEIKTKLGDIDSLSETITKFEEEIAPKLETLATKEYVDTLAENQEFLDGIAEGLNSNFVVKSELNAVANRVTALEAHDHDSFATKKECEDLATEIGNVKTSNLQTAEELNGKIDEINTVLDGIVGIDHSGFVTKEVFEAALAEKAAEVDKLKADIAALRAQIVSSTAGEVDQKNVSDLLNG